METMYITQLTLKNYRKFPQVTFRLNPQMNVFAGRNGTGKTSVLEAANVILGAYLAAYGSYVPSRFVFNLSDRDAHLAQMTALSPDILTTGGVAQYPCTVCACVNWDQSAIRYQRTLEKEKGRTKFDGGNPMKSHVSSWEKAIAQANHQDKELILPIVLYLSSARLWNSTPSSTAESGVYPRTDAYTRCLDGKHGIDLATNYLRMLRSVAAEENNGQPFPAFTAIMKAVNTAMQEELHPGEKIIFSTRYGQELVALQTKEQTVIPFASLSDGYRNVIKIILDIACRICILNPYLGADALAKTPGVVVIDEIDLSLHPTWQKRIIRILKELFPKVQFLCATHSPFIIQSLEEGELISLDGEIESSYAGESIEDIAEEIMGVSMPQYSSKKEKMFRAAEAFYTALNECRCAQEIDALRTELVRLEAEYSDNPAYLALIRQKHLEKEMEVTLHAPG